MRPARRPRWWLPAALLLVVMLLGGAAALVSGKSPRRALGLEPLAPPCDQSTARIRLPLGGPTGDRWSSAGELPAARDEVRAAAHGDRILVGSGLAPERGVLGGFGSLAELFEFDPDSGTFRRVEPLPIALDHPVFASDGESFFVVGGWNDGLPSARGFRLDGGRWSELPPMPTARAAAAGAVVDGKLFVIGGTTEVHDRGDLPGTGTVEIFDVRSGTWTSGPTMPTARHHHAAAAVGGDIVVVGGRSGLVFSMAAVERLGVEEGRWEEAQPLPLSSGALTAAGAGDRMVVAGGGDDGGGWVTPATWELTADDGWRRLPDLQIARHGHGMAGSSGAVWVFGGSPCGGYGRTASVERLSLP